MLINDQPFINEAVHNNNIMEKPRIMIIEDDAIEAMDIKINLESMGYEVSDTVSYGEEALLKLSQNKPDLVLVDIIIKGSINGLEVGQKIKDDFDMPFIFLTSHSEEKTIEKAKLTEPYAYIIKPFDASELKISIEIALHKHKMEKKLEKQAQYFKNIFKNAPIGIFHSTVEGKYIRVNKALSNMLRYESPVELINEVNKSTITEKLYVNPIKHSKFIDQIPEDDNWLSFKNDYYRKDGSVMIGKLSFRTIKNEDGTIKYLEGFITDITEQKESEEARMKIEMIAWDRLSEIEGIYDSSPIGLFTLDKNLRYIRINQNLAKVNGISAIKHIGKTPNEIIPTLSGQIEEMALNTLKTGKPIIGHEIEGVTPSKPGVIRTWIIQSVPFKDIHGFIIGISFSVLEITDMKRAQEKIAKTIEKLKLSNDELQRFAYVVSHDFKEPLRMVSYFTQLIKRRHIDKFDGEVEEFIGFIIEGSKRMERLLDDLLEYSRITSAEDKCEEINLDIIVEESIFNLKMAMEKNNVKIIRDPLPTVSVNHSQMIHVFQNLFANAIKFRSKKTPIIHISSQKEQNQWVIGVTDNGIGINPQYNKRIFDVFQRLHKRTEYDGTGMGLFITKKIVERHNGYIWVDSEPEKGSTFYFSLPFENTLV